jgi:formamidopyrimidine-DNA glycosylase
MPELPEVETVVRGLRDVVPGRRIRRARLSASDLYHTGSRRLGWIDGAHVDSVDRIGKAILFSLDTATGARALVVHLGMTGRFVVPEGDGGARVFQGDEVSAPGVDPGAAALIARHRHARIRFDDGGELWYVDPRRFGYFHLAPLDGVRDALGIGPDPFEMRPRRMRELLAGRTAPIKSLLLNQKVIAGLGNIYVDEVLHRRGVHPLTPARRLREEATPLLEACRRLLRSAIRFRGTTFRDYRDASGRRGGYQQRLLVYGREGEACRGCGGEIQKIVVGGRGTHFCPACQPRRGRACARR